MGSTMSIFVLHSTNRNLNSCWQSSVRLTTWREAAGSEARASSCGAKVEDAKSENRQNQPKKKSYTAITTSKKDFLNTITIKKVQGSARQKISRLFTTVSQLATVPN